MMGIAQTFITAMVPVRQFNKQDNGQVTVSFPDGQVMSVTSYGVVETRPAGTAGPQERATIDGDLLIFSVSGDNGSWAYCFPFTLKDLPF